MKAVRSFLVSLAIALAFLGVVEGSLRLAGFHRDAAPVSLRFGYPDPREMTDLFRPDPRLFWRLRPGSTFDAEAPVAINARGYRGRLPVEPKPEGTLRVAVLGDSVAFGGGVAWPEILERDLGPDRAEVLNYGVPGYTVVQGMRQYDDEVAALRPDVVVIAYGWNDHWLARGGLPDSARAVPSARAATIALLLGRLRITQALRAVMDSDEDASAKPVEARVPPDEFREDVVRLTTSAREGGARVVVVGLPSALAPGEVPAYLVDQGFTPSESRAIEDHARYVGLAREASERAGGVFVDAASAFAEGGAADPSLFTRDRIHLSARGHERLAALLAPVVAGGAP